MASEIKYQTSVDLANRNRSHTLLHELVLGLGKQAMEILEVGCSSGYLGATLLAAGHRVIGIEPDAASARAASAVLSEVFHGDLDSYFEANPQRQFDAIILGDVLEHLVDPDAALRRCVARLAPDGAIAISLPNITHGSVRAHLLGGRWDYAEKGILDRTHLHFFSEHGVAELLSAARLVAVRRLATLLRIRDAAREYGMALRPELVTAVAALSEDDSYLTFQHVVLARPAQAAMPAEALLQHNLGLPIETAIPAKSLSKRHKPLRRLRSALLRLLLR